MHPAPHPTTTVACTTHQPTDALGDTLARRHHISTATTHLGHATFPTEVTLEAIP